MSRNIRPIFITFIIAILAVPVLSGQQPGQMVAAPVPAQIIAGKNAFVSNAGMDAFVFDTLKRAAEPDRPYNQLYISMKSWGRYNLVAAPSDADLIFEIQFTAPLLNCGNLPTYAPQLGLRIVDAKTHFTLWTLVEPVEGAFRKSTWDKNFDQAMNNLMEDLKKLTGTTAAPAEKSQM